MIALFFFFQKLNNGKTSKWSKGKMVTQIKPHQHPPMAEARSKNRKNE